MKNQIKDLLEKNLMIRASAGSGKTYQLSNRIIGRVAQGEAPEEVVALTFTRKAAGEFADAVLQKLAKACECEAEALRLSEELKMKEKVDYVEVLRRVVKSLPRLTLGTMDSFFARIVKGFQYELGVTGGLFELVQGAKLSALTSELLTEILRDALEKGEADEFVESFRRANYGKEKLSISNSMSKYVKDWHEYSRRQDDELYWGVAGLDNEVKGAGEKWEQGREILCDSFLDEVEGMGLTKRESGALEKLALELKSHTAGSGLLKGDGTVVAQFFNQIEAQEVMSFTYFKKLIELTENGSKLMRQILSLLTGAEVEAALERTRGVEGVVRAYDGQVEKQMRRRGFLDFSEVKRLMGEWAWSEEARLRREAVDFRLDAKYRHWLLDEFQDTSRLEWRGMRPLVEEAVSGEGESLFIVGDQKQGIYGWRGGEVKLFEEVRDHYQMVEDVMSYSWRSGQAVLDLVNRVCGDVQTMEEMFGKEAVSSWVWDEHEPMQEKKCQSRVTVVEGKTEEKLDELVAQMKEVEVGKRAMSCGILVRKNDEVKAVADRLREEGFEVVEEGVRKPAEESVVGVALKAFINWLADPADRYCEEVVGMCPIGEFLKNEYGEAWQARWEGVMERVEEDGFARLLERVGEGLDLSEYGKSRVRDLVVALADLDAMGGATARDAARVIEELEVSQSPGVAAVQVMTIHKSKGLGFDVVFLPEISSRKIPDHSKYSMMEGDGWVCDPPVKWARDQFEVLRDCEDQWETRQKYEAFCMLYVALTRAKRGVYVLLEKLSKEGEGRASLANWVMTSCGSHEVGVIFESGSADWVEDFSKKSEGKEEREETIKLGEGVPMRQRKTPSSSKAKAEVGKVVRFGRGAEFGTAVHEEFEKVIWLDEVGEFSENEAGKLVEKCLSIPVIEDLFRRREGVQVYREQAFEILVEGEWMSGIIDRLEVGGVGDAMQVRVIDFKTDRVESGEELRVKYGAQMEAYRVAVQQIWSGCEVEVMMLSTHLGEVVAS